MEAPDADAVCALVNAAYRGSGGLCGWTSETELVDGPRISAAQVRALVAAPGSWLFGGWRGESLVACVHLARHGAEAHIGLLAVAPQWQGAGLGSCLLEYAESCARRLDGAQRLLISVLSLRPELIAYYQRRGYVPTGAETPYPVHLQVGDPKVPTLRVLHMVKPLRPVADPV